MRKTCDKCGNMFSTGYNLRRHVTSQHPSDIAHHQRGYGSEVIDSLPNKIKTIIVQRRLLGADEGVKKYISNLDHEMMSIMKNSTLPLDEKVLKYSQILRRHQNAKQELNKPFKIEVQTNESNDSLL